MVSFTAPPTTPRQNVKSISKQVLDTPMGESDGIAYTVRDYLEAASHAMSNDPRRAEAAELLDTLNRLSLGAPARDGKLAASIAVVRDMVVADKSDAMRFAPDVVSAAHIDNGGKGYDPAHATYAEYASTARALEGLTGPLNAMAQLQQQASLGRFS